MDFFDDRDNVNEYIKMADGYDGRDLIAVIEKHLTEGASVLELGMGPGKDLDLLGKRYNATGSDRSDVFLDLYREEHPDADLMNLDAVSLDTERTFDCIYSNKVLHHLTKANLRLSFARQKDVLNDGGLAMHSFWYGNTEEDIQGLRFVYYTEEELLKTVDPAFEVVEVKRYKEFENDDSFYILLQKR